MKLALAFWSICSITLAPSATASEGEGDRASVADCGQPPEDLCLSKRVDEGGCLAFFEQSGGLFGNRSPERIVRRAVESRCFSGLLLEITLHRPALRISLRC